MQSLAAFLDRRASAVIVVILLLTALFSVPFVGMPPTATASQEPAGEVFEARDLLAERLPWPVHHMVFVIEATDGNILDRDSLLELFTHTLALRADPELGGKLARWRSEVPVADIHGVLTLADVVNASLFARGVFGLQAATEEQVASVVDGLLQGEGADLFQLSPEARRDETTGRWVSPALLGHVLADNALLGGGSVDAVLGSDDTTKEEFARSVLAVQDLERSTRYFTEVLGFSVDPIRAPGWSFLSRGPVLLMLGECPDEVPARETGNHAWFLHILVEDVDEGFELAGRQTGKHILELRLGAVHHQHFFPNLAGEGTEPHADIGPAAEQDHAGEAGNAGRGHELPAFAAGYLLVGKNGKREGEQCIWA